MILLEDDVPGLLTIGQVQFVSFTEQENPLVLDYLTGLFFEPCVHAKTNYCSRLNCCSGHVTIQSTLCGPGR